MMSIKRILRFGVRFLIYLCFTPILIFLALPSVLFTLIEVFANSILEGIAGLTLWTPIRGNERNLRVIEYIFGRGARERTREILLQLRMQASVANDHARDRLAAADPAVMNDGLSQDEVQKIRAMVEREVRNVEAREFPEWYRVYLGQMMEMGRWNGPGSS